MRSNIIENIIRTSGFKSIDIVTATDASEEVTPEERQKKIEEVRQYVEKLRKENPKVAEIMSNLIDEIENDEEKYKGKSIMSIVESMK